MAPSPIGETHDFISHCAKGRSTLAVIFLLAACGGNGSTDAIVDSEATDSGASDDDATSTATSTLVIECEYSYSEFNDSGCSQKLVFTPKLDHTRVIPRHLNPSDRS